MISYEGLEKRLKEKGLKKSDLTQNPGISSRTVAKLAKGEKLSRLTLQKIADFLVCDTADLYRVVSANPILQRLRRKKVQRCLAAFTMNCRYGWHIIPITWKEAG